MRKARSVKENMVWNVIAQCSAMAYSLITYPYAARVLSTTSMGRFNFADTIVTYAITLAALGIPLYAVREGARKRGEPQQLERLSAQITTIGTLAALIVYLVLGVLILTVPRIGRETKLLLIMGISIILNVLGRDWLNAVFEDFFFCAVRNIVIQSAAVAATLLLVKKQDDLLLYGAIRLLSTGGLYLANCFHTARFVPLRMTAKPEIQKHLPPLLMLLGSTIQITVYANTDIIQMGFYRSDGEVAIYTLATRVYVTIKMLVNTMVAVIIPRLSRSTGSGEGQAYLGLLRSLRRILAVTVLPAIAVSAVFCRPIMWVLGGDAYTSGAFCLVVLSLSLAAALPGFYYSQAVLIPNERDADVLAATVWSALLNVVLNGILIPPFGMAGAAFATLGAESVMTLYCFWKGRKVLQMYAEEKK